jgi:Divergent CRAL/TRIO domain
VQRQDNIRDNYTPAEADNFACSNCKECMLSLPQMPLSHKFLPMLLLSSCCVLQGLPQQQHANTDDIGSGDATSLRETNHPPGRSAAQRRAKLRRPLHSPLNKAYDPLRYWFKSDSSTSPKPSTTAASSSTATATSPAAASESFKARASRAVNGRVGYNADVSKVPPSDAPVSRAVRKERQLDSPEYSAYLAAAHSTDLHEVELSGAVKVAGRDAQGRVIIIVTPCVCRGLDASTAATATSSSSAGIATTVVQNDSAAVRNSTGKRGSNVSTDAAAVAAATVTLQSVTQLGVTDLSPQQLQQQLADSAGDSPQMAALILHLIAVMDTVAADPYVLVFCNTSFNWLSWGRYSFLGHLHSLLPRRYRKNVHKFIVVHPTSVLKMFFVFAKLFVSPKVSTKMKLLCKRNAASVLCSTCVRCTTACWLE